MIAMITFTTTVSQNTRRNERFCVLCRNIRWASIAPGQPPNTASQCSVDSWTRRLFVPAADLSIPYAMKLETLVTR